MRHPLWLLTLARLREFLREPGALFWTFGFPLLMTVALGLAFRDRGPPAQRVAVIEGEGAAAAVAALQATGVLAPQVMSEEQAALAQKKAKVVLVVDANSEAIRYVWDAQRPDARAARALADEALQRAAGRADARKVDDRSTPARGTRYIDWLVPGLLGMQLMSGGMWGVGWAVVETRQRKLLKRLVATPMKRTHFLLSYILSRLFAVLFEVAILLGFAALSFDVVSQGSHLALVFISLLGAVSFAGLGLLCASRAQNTQTAGGLMNLAMLPMFVLSGVFFASTNFPAWMQPIISALPLTAMNDALRGVMNDGGSLFDVARPLAILGAWGVFTYALALRFFRWL
jgi:ABC transporter DrrB family efflux protein